MPKIKKQLTVGRPRSAVNKAETPSEPLEPRTPRVPKVSTTSELPKEVIGSHMGMMLPKVSSPAAVVVGKPPKLPPRPKKMPV